MAHLLQHHIVPVLARESGLGAGPQPGGRVQLLAQPRPARVWWTTSAPVSPASMAGISLAKVRLLPSMRMRIGKLLSGTRARETLAGFLVAFRGHGDAPFCGALHRCGKYNTAAGGRPSAAESGPPWQPGEWGLPPHEFPAGSFAVHPIPAAVRSTGWSWWPPRFSWNVVWMPCFR